jgi:hypothetical protein
MAIISMSQRNFGGSSKINNYDRRINANKKKIYNGIFAHPFT